MRQHPSRGLANIGRYRDFVGMRFFQCQASLGAPSAYVFKKKKKAGGEPRTKERFRALMLVLGHVMEIQCVPVSYHACTSQSHLDNRPTTKTT